MEQIFKKAVEGGLAEGVKDYPWTFVGANKYWVIWKNGNGDNTTISTSIYYLDPNFWQSLGKALGWEYKSDSPEHWKLEWHLFIDHLADGKDSESFFNDLLVPPHQ